MTGPSPDLVHIHDWSFGHTEFLYYLFIGYVEIKAIVEVYTGRNEPHDWSLS
jgi:hypothetical protein